MPKVKVRLLRPLDGHKEGAVRSFDAGDAERLAAFGAVTVLGPDRSNAIKTPKASTKAKAPSAAQRRTTKR